MYTNTMHPPDHIRSHSTHPLPFAKLFSQHPVHPLVPQTVSFSHDPRFPRASSQDDTGATLSKEVGREERWGGAGRDRWGRVLNTGASGMCTLLR